MEFAKGPHSPAGILANHAMLREPIDFGRAAGTKRKASLPLK